MSTQFEVVARVATNPTGSLSGNFQYTVYANGVQTAQGSCPIPTGSNACYTGHTVVGSQSIQVVIDSNNSIAETNEGNNSITVTCDKFAFTCN
jgi:subtilase family serine protease